MLRKSMYRHRIDVVSPRLQNVRMTKNKAAPSVADRHSGKQVQFRIEDELVEALDKRIEVVNAKRVLKLTRTDVARALFHSWAEGRVKIPELS